MRLQRILAASGLGSRRACETLIEEGRVQVNGRTAKLGDSADPAVDVVELDGERVTSEAPSYWMVNKPVGLVTTVRDPHGRETVMSLLPSTAAQVHPVGRLDRDSSGLLLLTNDGALTQRLLHPSHESEKEYRVTVKGQLGGAKVAQLCRGIHLDDGRTAPCHIEALRFDPDAQQTRFDMVLTEGRKRQIRRMLLAVGHPVKKLVRVRMGPLRLGRLAAGKARPLRADEVRALRRYADELKPARRSAAAARRMREADRA